jgi:asparagine synthetase B (glutamine-hydrolysing)
MAFLAGIFDPQLRLSPDDKNKYLADMARALQRRGQESRTVMFDDGRLALAQGGDAAQPAVHPSGQSVLAYDGSIYGVTGVEENDAPLAPARLVEIMAKPGFMPLQFMQT